MATDTIANELAELTQDVTNETTVDKSAITFMNGFASMLATAVSQAVSNGATPAQLAGFNALGTTIQANAAAMAAAITANTPVATAPPSTSSTAPASLTATPTAGQIALAWPAVTNATAYNVYRATTAGAEGATPLQSGVTGPTFVDTSVASGTAYFYEVTAIVGGVESAVSPEATATAV